MRSLRDNTHAVVDLGVVLLIGIAFAALMVVAFIIFTLRDQLFPHGQWVAGNKTSTFGEWTAEQNQSLNNSWNSVANVTIGFDDAVNLILVAITVFILAIAISALLMLRGRQ